MSRLCVVRKRSVFLLAGLIAVALAATITCAAVVMQVQRQVLIPGVPEKIIDVPTARLQQVATGKAQANMAVLRQTYFVRNDIPHIRLRADEFKLLPLSQLEYTPSAQELQASQQLPVYVAPYRSYVYGQPYKIPNVVDHRPNQTSVKDQAGRLTCVCFASMAGLEVAYGGTTIDLSENHANYLYMKAETRGCKSAGLQTHMSADYLSDHGVCREAVCPYQTSYPTWCNNGANPAPTKRADAEANCPFKIKSYYKIWRKDDLTTDTGTWINNPRYLEAILRSGKDIVFGTHVAGWSGDCTGVLDVQLGPGGDPLPSVAGHAMLICGYDRPEEYFIVKNSWGTDKGQDGYFYLSYDYIRTYAKYGYVIEEVKPIPLTPALQRMKTTPRMLPKLIQPESE